MKAERHNLRLGYVIGPLLILFACISAASIQGFGWLNNARERGRSSTMMREAKVNLYLGMSKQEAEYFLQDVWSHRQCKYSGLSRDLYFFGSSNPELSAVLILRFEKHENRETLTDIATVDNNSLVLGHYSECTTISP